MPIRKLTLLFCCLLTFLSGSFGQTVQGVVVDQNTQAPIPDVFVFLANSSLGDASDEDGRFSFELTEPKEIVLVFSHINYALLTLEVADAGFLRDTFFLQATEIELSEAEVATKSRPRLRARRQKAFTRAFLGETTDANLVQIKNPEVLLFDQQKDKLVATAKSPLVIENRRLGYQLRFYLQAFALHDNGDLLYRGNTFFEAINGDPETLRMYQKNRESVYRKSSRRFFSDLVRHQLDSNLYAVGYSQLDPGGAFVNFIAVSPAELIQDGKGSNEVVEIPVRGFLTVINREITLATPVPAGRNLDLGLGVKEIPPGESSYATSYLRSRSHKIVVNRYGKILNPSDIEEYGYWTGLRVSALLPSDYRPE